MKIEELLARPEGKTLEFKLDLSSPKNILKTLTAFANTAGGVLLVGIEDGSKAVLGVEHALDEEERLCNLIADSIEPRLAPSVELVNWKGRTLLAVEVYPSALRPHWLKSQGIENGVLVRVGSTNRQADGSLTCTLHASLVRCAAPSALNHEAHPDPGLTRLSNGWPLGPRASRPQNTRAFASQRLAQSASGCRSLQSKILGDFLRARRPRSQGRTPRFFDRTQASAGLVRDRNELGASAEGAAQRSYGLLSEFLFQEQPLTAELPRSALHLSYDEEPMPESNPEALDFRVDSGLFAGLPAGGLTIGKEREA